MNRVTNIRGRWNDAPLAVRISIAYAVCSVIQRCLDLITLPLFTRLLTAQQFGQTIVYSSWSAIMMIFLTLQLPYGTFSRAMVKYEDRRDEYIASVEGICLLISFVFLCIYIPFRDFWGKLFELPVPIIVLMVFEILGKTAILIWSGKKRFEFRYKEVIALTILISLLTVILQIILVCLSTEKGYARIVGGSVVYIVVGGTIFVRNAIRGKRLYNKELWKYALGFNIPLLVYYLSQMIFNQSDRIMISHIVGEDKAAVYGVAYSVGIVMVFVLDAINNAYSPWIYGLIKEHKQEENIPVSNGVAVLMAVLLLVTTWFAPEMILILGGEQYVQAQWIVAPVAGSILLLFYSQLFTYYAFFYEKKKALVLASAAAAVTNIVLNAWFIPRFGFVAAGYTTLFSYILFCTINYIQMIVITKEIHIKGTGISVKSLALVFLIFSVFSSAGMLFYSYFVIRLYFLLGLCILLIVFRREIERFYRKAKERWGNIS